MIENININAHLFSHGFILAFFAIFLLLANVFLGYKRHFAFSVSFIAIVFALFTVFTLNNGEAFNGLFVFDSMSKFASIIILLASLIFTLCEKDLDGDFYALFLFMIVNFIALVSTSNLAVMFISLEASSLALFALIALKNTQNAVRASLKYFIYSGISGAFFCLGAALWYFAHKNIDVSYTSNIIRFVDVFCFVLFLIPIMFKLSLAPFHLWLEDVYKNANENLSGFISVVPKMAIFVVAFRIFYTNSDLAKMVFYIPCIFAMVFAGILAIKSSSFKQTLVYSSLVNSAFVFTLVCSDLNSFEMSFYSLMFYWGIFTFVNMSLFLFLSIVKKDDLCEFEGFLSSNKALGSMVIFFFLCLGAIPPFGLFYPKLLLMLTHAQSFNIAFVIALAISSALIIVAYAKIIKAIAFSSSNKVAFMGLRVSFLHKVVFCIGIIVGAFAIFGINVIEYLI